jgi:hypothetical protein
LKLGIFTLWLVLAAWEVVIQFSRHSATATKRGVVEIGAIACVCSVLFLVLLTRREQKGAWGGYSREGKKQLRSDYSVMRLPWGIFTSEEDR